MRKLTVALTLILWGFMALPASAGNSSPPDEELQIEVSARFGEILDLWRDGNYQELYLRTTRSGKQSRESFLKRLSASGRRPACCWEKLQDVRVAAKGPDSASVHARVVMERRDGNTDYVTRKFTLEKEEGVWKIAMSDILLLAGKGRK